MNKILTLSLSLFFSGLLLLSGQQKQKANNHLFFYKEAENFYNSETPTSRTDSLAIIYYKKVIDLLEPQKNYEPLLVDCYTKSGIVYQMNNNNALALENFSKATLLQNVAPSLPDSIFFRCILFKGGIYYEQNNYDSAFYYFKKAEVIGNKYQRIPEVERLYNKMGALYYQTGNYKQSVNYFNKSITLLNNTTEDYTEFLVQYKTNLGAAYFKLKEYDKAMEIYQSLLLLKSSSRPFVLHNMGSIYLEKGDYAKALQTLQPLNYNRQFKLTDLARIYINLHNVDSAKYYLDSALAENKKMNGTRKNITQGLALKFYGDFEISQNNIKQAIHYYQQSIIEYDPDFFENEIAKNPIQFNGLHSSFNLFSVLVAKAEAFKLLFKKENNISTLNSALSTYEAAFNLAHYVERFLDTDEARLFLKEQVEVAYSGAVETALEVYELTGNKKYLQQAFAFSETNKASILLANRQQIQIEEIPEIPKQLVHAERNYKFNIARLTLQMTANADNETVAKIGQQIRDYEINLSKVQDKLNENARYNQLRFNHETISVKKIQDDFIDKNTAVLSYYFSTHYLTIFVITSGDFTAVKILKDSSVSQKVIDARTMLETEGNYNTKTALSTFNFLYNQLISPVYQAIKSKTHLVIIPHTKLHYIPFEILKDPATGNYLLHDFAVSYNYAAYFLTPKKNSNNWEQKVLAFAPFTQTQSSLKDSLGKGFAILSKSKSEVQSLNGKIMMDTTATKNNFMLYAGKYDIIHLATHATANDNNPLETYIAFYPRKDSSVLTNRLYESEIYNLNLSHTSLVVLSACETGKGRLIGGEGIMSLSRAFSYAGCPSVITSLWKAEDNATAFIIKQFYKYLQQGLAKDEALQKAKLAYLESGEIEPQFKSPVFWAHLILVGDPSSVYKSKSQFIYWLVAGVGVFLMGIIFYHKWKITKSTSSI